MSRTLIAAGAFAVRAPALQQPPVRRPALRLVVRDGDAPFPRVAVPATRPRPRVEPVQPLTLEEEDAERWDGLA